MYKIYINEKPVFLCSEEEFPNIKNEAYSVYNEQDILPFGVDFLQKINIANGIIYVSEQPEALFKRFTQTLIVIEAAGGLILNPKRNKILFIYRRNKWDLPKGKIDKGESIKKAAWREVAEECGLSTHQIEDHLCDTYHIYEHKNKWILKKTYWYLMSAEEEQLTPQLEEDITRAEWILVDDVMNLISEETYPLILDILMLVTRNS